MQTRKDRFAKYRASIKMMSDSEFTYASNTQKGLSSADASVLRSVSSASAAISYGPNDRKKEAPKSARITPYDRYLKRKRAALIFKFGYALLVIAGLVVAYFIMMRN